MRRLRRPEERHPGAARFGGHRKAPQLLVARAREPGEERMAACGAQHLLGRPQRVAAPRSAHQRELGEIDAAGG